MSNDNGSTSGGDIFVSLLAVLFIGLKLTGYIDWPWIWVLCPIWIGFAITVAFLVISFLVLLVVEIFK